MMKMRKRILILNHIFWPDKINTARHVSELAEELFTRGFEISVMVGDRDYRTNEKFLPKEYWNGIQIKRVHIPILFGRGWLQRIFTSVWLLLSFSLRLIFDRNYNFVILGSNPPFIYLMLPWLRIIMVKSKIFLWSFDLYPDAIFVNLSLNGKMFESISGKIAKYFYTKLDALVDIGPCMRNRISGYTDRVRFYTLTPWSFVERISMEIPHAETRKNLFGDASLTILYTGTIGNAHEFETFLGLARKLREIDADVGFCFAGFGSKFKELKSRILNSDTNISLANFVNSDIELEQRISAADLMMVSLRSEWTGISVPSKFFTCIATGKPVLYSGSEDSAISIWINEFNLGFQVSESNIEEVAHKLKVIAKDKSLIQEMKMRSIQVYQEKFSRRVVCDGWSSILANS